MIDFVREAFQVSIRRACRAVPAPRATYHYRSRRPEQAPLRKRIREIAERECAMATDASMCCYVAKVGM